MEKKELIELAKTYEEAILESNLSKHDMVILLAILDARLKSKIYSSSPAPSEVIKTGPLVATTTPVVHKKKSVSYDSMYDPPPGMSPDPVPEHSKTGVTLAKRNAACTCGSCNTVVYLVNKDITDGCSVREFIESFSPTPGNRAMSDKIEIQNIDGRISIDCPACNSSKTLYLTGKR